MRLEINAIVITFYLPTRFGQETAKGPFGLRVKLPLAHHSTTRDESFTLPFQYWKSSKVAMSNNFHNLWFDPTGNWTQVYRLSNRRSIHSNTDRLTLNDVIYTAKQFCEQSLKLYDFCENEITANM